NTAYLAMLYGGNQYMVDTASVVNGTFAFESVYDLESGVYLVILPPSKNFIVLVDQNVKDFSFKGDLTNLEVSLQFEGSPDNAVYYEYLRFFQSKKGYIDQVRSDYEKQTNEPDKAALLATMQQLKKDVIAYQSALVAKDPRSLTAAMVKCELPVETPSFSGSPEEINLKKYQFQKAHYFDNIDLSDERLIRAPKNVLVDRVEYFLDNLTVQNPDSIISSVDYILSKSENNPVSYRFLLTHIFNKYREAKSIGMDGIYVHIAEEYIAKGKTPWIEDDERNKVLAAVKLISPTLIGKQAPNFTVQLEDGKDISLNDIQSPYTVLFFWSPNCTHCQQSIPTLTDFYKTYKDKGVQVFAVCTKLNEQEKNCWEYLEKNDLHNWINASDQMGGGSSIHTQYNIKTTPKIYVLDKDKTIIAKDLGVEHLEEVMRRLIP
ncbi:MAG TPA: redoxin domain-containing protein, partial [Saprospiraceae bacterium]|nr:redoxin domain-containing protein [Saprospiraceae bacterium]